MNRDEIDAFVRLALAEDAPWGDVTSESVVPPLARADARIVARQRGVICGLVVAHAAFGPDVKFIAEVADGDVVQPGQVVATVSGLARAILRAERVVLNILQRLSGIATLTAQYVDAVDGCRVRITDTRKTTPGLRGFERYAVRCGGGHNHRYSLSDAVLVKDNHRAVLAAEGRGLAEALRTIRREVPHPTAIEVEIDSLDDLDEALAGAVDCILLDNMTLEQMAEAVRHVDGRVLLEASGGVTLETVRAIAETGVDIISVGALTHSAPALDLGLDFGAPRLGGFGGSRRLSDEIEGRSGPPNERRPSR